MLTPYYHDHAITIYNAHVLDALKDMPDSSVHCVVTSPPYWGLRDYGIPETIWGAWKGSFGLEPTPGLYVQHTVEIFREVCRVLRDDGTLWLNMGDSYAGSGKGLYADGNCYLSEKCGKQTHGVIPPPGLKPKDLVGIPWMVAFALRADGWYLRQDIIWAKHNPMPESVTDRCTKSHEYVFLLSKSARYYYDAEAIKEKSSDNTHERGLPQTPQAQGAPSGRDTSISEGGHERKVGRYPKNKNNISFDAAMVIMPGTRNKRSVWTINTQPYSEEHFATFPEALPEICIKAGMSEKGCCPGCGAPWERVVEKNLTAHDGKTESGYSEGSTAKRMSLLRQAARERGEEYSNKTKTIGWRCTCNHEFDPVSCTVLDPFAGSGTTLKVAEKLGRRSIGIEIKKRYCELIGRRAAQVNLFIT